MKNEHQSFSNEKSRKDNLTFLKFFRSTYIWARKSFASLTCGTGHSSDATAAQPPNNLRSGLQAVAQRPDQGPCQDYALPVSSHWEGITVFKWHLLPCPLWYGFILTYTSAWNSAADRVWNGIQHAVQHVQAEWCQRPWGTGWNLH